MRSVAGLLPPLVLAACAHDPPAAAQPRPAVVEARSFFYSDDSGLTVATLAGSINQRVTPALSLYARFVSDYIHLARKQLDPSDPTESEVLTGHRDADVVTSASALPSGGGATDKWRSEIAGGPTFEGEIRGRPASLGALVRASFEPDYRSYSGVMQGALALFQQNLVLSGFVGLGHDDVIPPLAPAGQAALWPASHDRVTAGWTLSQTLSERLVFSAGLAGSRQQGQLASPYRRALVKTTLFPEVVPDVRARATSFLALSDYVARGTAIHVRLGAYADSWGIRSLVPEAAVTRELGPRWLLSARYRLYAQTQATFYEPVYSAPLPIMSGDPRAGTIRAQAAGFVAELGIDPRLVLLASYDFSSLDYLLLGQHVNAQIASLGATLSY